MLVPSGIYSALPTEALYILKSLLLSVGSDFIVLIFGYEEIIERINIIPKNESLYIFLLINLFISKEIYKHVNSVANIRNLQENCINDSFSENNFHGNSEEDINNDNNAINKHK